MPTRLPPKNRQLLQSWKEIAAYLNVTVRTVQRWEKESGLPVRRQGTGRKARVLGYTDEVDAWLNRHQADVAPRTPKWLIPAAAAVLLCALLSVGIWFLISKPALGSAVIEPTRLTILDEKGRIAWQKEFPRIDLRVYGDHDSWRFVNVDNDPEKEVLFNYVPEAMAESQGKLICYDTDGRLMWQFQYGKPRRHRNRQISDNYAGVRFQPVRAANRDYILTVAGHHLWFPSQLALLDPATGKVIDEYWHPGGFRSLLVRDLDRDGKPEALLGGINNPGVGLGHGCLALLDIPFGKAKTVSPPEMYPYQEFTEGKERAYILFPRPDISDVQGALPLISEVSFTDNDRTILVRLPGPEVTLFYYLDLKLRLKDFRFADNLPSVHDRLWRLGLLDHKFGPEELSWLGRIRSFPTAPDGNSPEILDLMRTPEKKAETTK